MKAITIMIAFGLLGFGTTLAAGAVIGIGPAIPIYVSKGEPEPLLRAVEDLQRDLRKVLGSEPPIIHDREPLRQGPAIVVIGPAAEVSMGEARWAKGWEAHRLFVETTENIPHIVLQGADMRGAIYAVYSFSEHFLEVPPLWVWASHEVERKDEIEIPLSTDLHFESPHVRWRASFPNGQDCLAAWKAKSSNREAIAETLLRLKLNAWDTGALVNDTMTGLVDDAQMARDRGIVAMSTHTSPLGTRMEKTRWNNYWRNIRGMKPPEMNLAGINAMVDFWKHSISVIRAENLETIWTVTFRAHGDLGFWHGYTDAPETDVERAALVQGMIERQVALVDEFVGPNAVVRIPLYNEMSDYFLAGLLDLPARNNIIWNLVAARRDHYPPEGIVGAKFPNDQPLGLYFNLDFVSTGSHVVQGEGPWKMEANYRAFDSLSEAPLALSIVNTGNLRELVMELSANARMMWDFESFSADSFLMEFSAQYFGKAHAREAAALYREFYDSYWEQQRPAIDGFARQFIFHDLRYARMMREILPHLENGRHTKEPVHMVGADFFCIVPEHNDAANTLDAVIAGTASSIARLQKVAAGADALMRMLPENRRVFFNDNLRVQAHFMLRINQSLHRLALALDQISQPDKKKEHLAASLEAFRHARRVLTETEHGPFQKWHPRTGERDYFRFDQIESQMSRLPGQPRPW